MAIENPRTDSVVTSTLKLEQHPMEVTASATVENQTQRQSPESTEKKDPTSSPEALNAQKTELREKITTMMALNGAEKGEDAFDAGDWSAVHADLLKDPEAVQLMQELDVNAKNLEAFTLGKTGAETLDISNLLQKNAQDLSLDDLSTLAQEKSGREHLLKSFTKVKSANEAPDQKEGFYPGKEIAVDFGNNNDAYWNVGMGDMFPGNVRVLTVTDAEGNTLTGTRAPNPDNPNPQRVGYYTTAGEYIPVFSGDTVRIDSVATPEQMKEIQQELQKQYENDPQFKGVDWMQMAEKALESIENIFQKGRKKELTEKIRVREEFLAESEALLKEQGIDPENMSQPEIMKSAAEILAKQIEKDFGIPYKVTLAQTVLETGGFEHIPDGNFFGIKGGNGPLLATKESRNGRLVPEMASFRSYGSMADSFYDYARFLTKTGPGGTPHGRYAGAFAYKDNPREFLRAVHAAGYATDEKYLSKAESSLRRYYGYTLA